MAKTVWDRIEEARARHDVLQHPFYVRWSAGELTAEELARYSGQYRHAVTAIADLSAEAAAELPEHPELAGARRRGARPRRALGRVRRRRRRRRAAPSRPPRPRECVEVWTERDGALRALARLYAIESGQPEISKTKLEGLADHYGVDSEPGHPLLHGPPRPRRRARRRGPGAARGADPRPPPTRTRSSPRPRARSRRTGASSTASRTPRSERASPAGRVPAGPVRARAIRLPPANRAAGGRRDVRFPPWTAHRTDRSGPRPSLFLLVDGCRSRVAIALAGRLAALAPLAAPGSSRSS